MPLVSVLMPMRNAKPYVRAALESVLNQAEVDLEVIVMDDGSTDGSADVVRELGHPRVRLLAGPCAGIAANFNAALEEAHGDVIMRCDADDKYEPGRIARQVRWLEEHPEFGAVCARFTTMNVNGEVLILMECGGSTPQEITEELRDGTTRTHFCTYAVRTAVLRQTGGCRPWFVTAEDIDLQLRLSAVTRVWFDPCSGYLYRFHDASITHTQGNPQKDFYERTAREFAAQRRGGRPDDLEQGRPPEIPESTIMRRQGAGSDVQGMLLGKAWFEHATGNRLQALRTGLRACLARPQQLRGWKNLLALLYKRPASVRR